MAGLVTRLAAKVADTWKETHSGRARLSRLAGAMFDEADGFMSRGWTFPHQTVRCAPLMLLRDVGHVRKYHREGDGEDAGHGNDCKVPPEGCKNS